MPVSSKASKAKKKASKSRSTSSSGVTKKAPTKRKKTTKKSPMKKKATTTSKKTEAKKKPQHPAPEEEVLTLNEDLLEEVEDAELEDDEVGAEDVEDTEDEMIEEGDEMGDESEEDEEGLEEVDEDDGDGEDEEEKPAPKKKALKKEKKKTKKGGDVDEDDAEAGDIDSQLSEIYENNDGSMPDMSQFETKKKRKFITAIIVLLVSCAFLAAVAWAGFFMLGSNGGFQEEGVVMSISASEEAVVGQEQVYRVRYRNDQDTTLNGATLVVRYPEGFVVESVSETATDDAQTTWDIGQLGPQESGYIDIAGRVYGDIGQKQSLRAFFSFVPENFSSEFQKVATTEITVGATPFQLVLEAPDSIVSGVESQFVMRVSKEDADGVEFHVDNLALVFDAGDQFKITESSQDPDRFEDAQWTIGSLGDEPVSIAVSGVLSALLDQEKEQITARLVGWKDGETAADSFVLVEKVVDASIAKTDVGAQLVINGATGDFTAQPGENLQASIAVVNAGEISLDDVRVQITFDAPSFDDKSLLYWSELVDEYDGRIRGEQLSDDVRRGEITWTSAQISALASLDTDDEVIIDLQLPIKDGEAIDLTQFATAGVQVDVQVQYEVDGEQKTLQSNTIDIAVVSDVKVAVQDEIDEDDDGEMHTITWLVSNTMHELSDLVLEADIYGDIVLTQDDFVVPAGEVMYDEEAQHVRWEIDQMPTSIDVLALQFPVTLTSKNPSQTQLVSKVRLSAFDTVAQTDIVGVGDEILLIEE